MNRAGEGQLSLFPPEPAPDPLPCWLWLAGTVGAGLFDEEYRRKNDVSVRAEKIICKVHLDEQDALSLQERLGFKKVILFHAIKEKNKSLLESFKERNIEALTGSLPQTITL